MAQRGWEEQLTWRLRCHAPAGLTGVRKAAILTLVLGEDAASQIFKFMSEEEIEVIAREVATLRQVKPDDGSVVLEEFHHMWKAAEYLSAGGVEYAQKVLVKSLGPEMARRVLDRVIKSFESTMAFTGLERADPQQLSKFILSEHPQTIALILAHLKPAQAAQLANTLPEELRVEVITRMANLDEISPEVITRISAVIDQRLKSLGSAVARIVRRRARGGGAAESSRPERQPRWCSRASRRNRRIWRCRSAT